MKKRREKRGRKKGLIKPKRLHRKYKSMVRFNRGELKAIKDYMERHELKMIAPLARRSILYVAINDIILPDKIISDEI